MGRTTAALVCVVLAAACSDTATTTTSVAVTTSSVATTSTTSTTALPPTSTSSTTIATSTVVPPEIEFPALIVANTDGAFLIEPEFSFLLVGGPVEAAFDDGEGGVVFQRASQRFGTAPTDTIIEYLPPDSFEPQDLLVPTGEQYLELRDVAGGAVWYTRSEGFDFPETATETLRTFDLDARSVTEVAITGGWESGAGEVSVSDGLIATYWFAEAASGFDFLDWDGESVSVLGDPYAGSDFCADGGERFDVATGESRGLGCFEWPALSEDGRLAFIERNLDDEFPRYFLVVVDLASGTQIYRSDLERPDQGWQGHHLEIRGDFVLVNRFDIDIDEARQIGALLVDLTTGQRLEIPFSGRASFLTGPMGID